MAHCCLICYNEARKQTAGGKEMDKATHSHLIKGYIITICGGLGWAIGGACGQVLFRDCGVDADWLVPIRMFLAGLMVLVIAKLCGKPIGAVWRDKASIFPLLVFALIGTAMCQYSYYAAIQYTNVAFATVMTYMSPIVILLFVLVHSRRLPKLYELTSVILVAVGATLCATHGDLSALAVPPIGLAWGLISAVCFAFYTLCPRRLMQKFDVMSIVGWGMTIGGGMMLLIFRPWTRQGVQYSAKLFVLMAIVIVFGTILAFNLYQTGCSIVGSMVGGVLSSVEPVASVIISAFLLHTSFVAQDFAGFALILITIPIMTLGDYREVWAQGK